ncbi:hypothetical protein [Sphingomonas flavescens]|uniref:hypothetical protein n=1 Tax=Sphingomonas flavescens TaxID=3132797 RepID=UPI0028061BC7|nr:hypothetical protein [Sphingomonas limnosediminicola]
MPAWSTEIANEFLRLAVADGRLLDQMQLQDLTYIAHGWCLAATDQPLTGDRPEALADGPEYRLLAKALRAWGTKPVRHQIPVADLFPIAVSAKAAQSVSALETKDRDWVARTYMLYAMLDVVQLSPLIRQQSTAWDRVFAQGKGAGKEIPHALIKAQFVELSANHSGQVHD